MSPIIFMLAALAAAPPPAPDAAPTPRPEPPPHLECFPADAVAVPGLPGAMSHPDVPAGYVLIEGDIQVRADEYRDWLMGTGTFGAVDFWDVLVPVDFAASVSQFNRQLAINAMNAITDRAGVFFVLRTDQPDFIRFNASTTNNSAVGRQGGMQIINIFSWNSQFVIIHELYHALGFHHEQSRADRDTYVTINLGNVCQDCCGGGSCNHNFALRPDASFYGPYDFDSFMHYPATAFSVNGQPTITVNEPFTDQWQGAIGQRNHFSRFDEITCRGVYRFALDRWWKPGAGGEGSGNIVNPMHFPTFAAAYDATPEGGVLFIKDNANYPAVGTYSKALRLEAPTGATLGN